MDFIQKKDVHARDRMMIQWMKFGGLVFDINHDEAMKEIFQGTNDDEKYEALSEYGLTAEDCNDFISAQDDVMLRTWWIGDEDQAPGAGVITPNL